ncbi:MAG: hypothetical protein FGM58_05980 [Acidimicrobiia bacterium]|nr:hypothetical protein [Acidimicrobiia bacterium]
MPNQWSNLVNPTVERATALVSNLDAELGDGVHDIVRMHFASPRPDLAHVFPRLETHHDRYVFGQFHLPTSATDLRPEFMEFTFVLTFDRMWSIVRFSDATPLTDRFLERVERARSQSGSVPSMGDVLGRMMTVVVSELERFLDETGDLVISIDQEIDIMSDSRNLSRVLKDQMPKILNRLVDVRSEIISIGSVVDQMEDILGRVMRDEIDLRRSRPDGSVDELFGRNTEIHLLDTWLRARRVRVLQDEQLERLRHCSERVGFLRDHDELTSGRFMGAIASIMLVPTFLVGLYGMNFEWMPELHWQGSYVLLISGIIAVTAFQIWIFRRRRWI